ncbi:mandelate racemase/muconate lactonizing enzyme family protein [Picrophilus oshimae]|uniref:gluconate dehydratase n=1 Tax=Picrophilus torridus (strain ATCC 700027 / DSM 9790 / JCM 10055 / NBRC 100828 / KAW 2/3) TaxID=1122961 RepID=A0A8G2FW80_PICTO|nr:mandelate racemase/muconate lactonizing enzyme family protein [Picrophilus oshimae]SMD30623.1 gluconate dehydratase /galactonate dehydratase [Picrophilus oshimae DSM 9789]
METIKSVDIYELGSPGEKSSPWSSTILIVKLTSSNGNVGYGEAPTTFMTLPVKESMREVERVFKDQNYFNIEKNMREFYKHSFYLSRSMEATSALSAFEIASWDLIGKDLGTPVYNLLGGEYNSELRAYANGWYSDCLEPDDFVSRAKEYIKKGYTAFKFDPFRNNFDRIGNDGIKKAVDIVSAMRSELGENIDLLIECHGRFSTKYAIKVGQALDEFNPLFIEEPIHPEMELGLFDFKRYVNTPVALGERLLNKEDFARYISQGMVDIVQADLTNSKGILEAKKISAIVESFGGLMAFHNAFGPVQTAATLNVDYTLTNFLIQESFEDSWPDWKRNLFSGYRIENGHFKLSGKPGLGITADEKLMEKLIYDGMEEFNKNEPSWVVSGTYK